MAIPRSLLRHRCTIQRQASSGTDAHGQPSYSWEDVGTSVPCLLQVSSSSGWPFRNVTVVEDVVQVRTVLYLLPDQDITERDRVTSVTDINGTSVDAGPFEVLAVADAGGQGRMKQVTLRRLT